MKKSFFKYSTQLSNKFSHVLWVIVFSIFILSCSSDDDNNVNPKPKPKPKAKPTRLISSKEVKKLSKTAISTNMDVASLFLPQFKEILKLKKHLKHDVVIYHITYSTSYKGKKITASGIVVFPKTKEKIPLLSFQHGTMVAHSQAPTKNTTLYHLLGSLASAGYIFIIPDFIGFGASERILHPYYHKKSTTSSVTDMLIAAKELSAKKGYKHDGNVFLAGYSEGGYATMAAHQSLENKPIEGFDLVASAPASGGYDIKGMQRYFFAQTTYHQPYYLAYVALAYQKTYDWKRPLTDFFQEPYASNIPKYFDGSSTGAKINAKLTKTIADYINPDLMKNIDSDSKYSYINKAFEENRLDNWKPTKRMFMYHGTADTTVPYQNSVDTYDKMKSLGVNTKIVTLTSLQGKTHGTGLIPYMIQCMDKFEKLK